jgi:hypothetical protein
MEKTQKASCNGEQPSNLEQFLNHSTTDWMFFSLMKASIGMISEQLPYKHKTREVYLLVEANDGK